MKTLIQDIRYGFRTLLRQPGFTAAAIAALALGIGANSAIFSFVHGVLLKKLPYANQDRVQMIYVTNRQLNSFEEPISVADFLDIQSRNSSFERVAAYQRGVGFILPTDQGAEFLSGAAVTAEFFSVLGSHAEAGRTFQFGEDAPGTPQVVVISDRFWRRQFDADPAIVGRIVNFSGGAFTVVGVMPREFAFPNESVDVWRTLRFANPASRGRSMWALGRLKEDATADQAKADLEMIGRQIEQAYPATNTGVSFRTMPVDEFFFGDVRTPLYVLLGAVLFVLLIASANVANLLLARSTAREKEVAIRSALGAGRTRIARQLLTESIVLAVIGGAFGLMTAGWVVDLFRAIAPGGIPRLHEVQIDSTVLSFTIVVTLFSGLLFGLAPALQLRKVDLNARLKEAGRGKTVGGHNRLRSILVVSEIALSLILLAGAGITIRSFVRLEQVDTGFDPTNVLAIRMGVTGKYNTSEKMLSFYDALQGQIQSIPGVRSTGLTSSLPPIENDLTDTFMVEGHPLAAGETAPQASLLRVTPGYFSTLAIPVIRGRAFSESDRPGRPAVTMISETLSRRYFQSENPIGQRLKVGGADRPDNPWMEIVGVVKDVRYDGLQGPVAPTYYLPYAQSPLRGQDLVIRTTGDPAALISAIRAEVRQIDPDIPFLRVTTLNERMAAAVGQPRFQTLLLGGLAGIALLLAAIGIYAVISYSTSLRTHEIGIRMSLGANRRDVVRMVIREAIALVFIGVCAGLAGALALTRLMSGELFEVSPGDPATLIVVSAIMTGVALIACLIPAWRATRVDPMIALRLD
jgi:putative ABC transport system permease protein